MLAAAVLVCMTTPAWSQTGKPLVDITDPRNDDKGPGGYIYPSDQNYHPGQFDLRRFRVYRDKTTVVFLIEVDSPLRRPPVARFSDAFEIKLENGVYVQNFDICIDSVKGQGAVRSIPGRRVRFLQKEAWDVCILVTPLPFRARSLIDGWHPGGRVVVPTTVRSYDRTIEVRVPEVELGGPPSDSWGYQVLVSGCQWQNTIDAVNRLLGSHVTNVYTMPVTTVAEQLAFGGGELSDYHPWVIDVLMPPLKSQYRVLSGHDAQRRRFAAVPMVYPNPTAHEAAVKVAKPAQAASKANTEAVPKSAEFVYGTIKDVSDELVVLDIDPTAVAPFRLGDVLDDEGQVVARVVTSQIHQSFVVATPVSGRERIRPDMQVRFRKPKEK